MNIFKLFGSVMVDTDKANESLAKTDKSGRSLSKTLGAGIKTAAKVGVALGGMAVAGGAAILGMASKAGEAADRILDLSSVTGMTTKSIQQWEKVSKIAGVNLETFTNASQKLTKSMDSLSTGTGKGAEALESLGISFEDFEKMSPDERLDIVTASLSGIEDAGERSRIGVNLLGGSFSDLAPVLGMSADELNKVKDSAHVISDKDLMQADNFRKKMVEMKDQAGAFGMKLAMGVMPMANDLMNWVQGHMPTIQKVTETAFDLAGKAVKYVGDIISDHVYPALVGLYEWIEPYFPQIEEFFMTSFGIMESVLKGIIDTIKSLSKFFTEHWDIIQPILIGIGAGATVFGLYTLAINAAAIATGIWSTVTGVATVVGGAFGAVMAFITSPIGLVVIAIGLLVAAGILLYKNFDSIKAKGAELWESLKDAMRNPVNFILGGINLIITAYESMINGLGKAINKIPKIKIPDWVPGFGGKEFGIPNIPEITLPKIPMMEDGGTLTRGGRVIVGERAPEILDLPTGARVTPLTGAGAMGTANIYVQLDGRIIGKAIGQPLVNQIRVKTGLTI